MVLFRNPERGAITMFISRNFKPYAAKFLPVVTVLLLSFGSYHSAMASQNVVIDMSKPISANQLAAYNRDGIAIDYDNTPVLREVYVTDKSGITAYQLPSGAAKKVQDYPFSAKLEVIEDNKEWYGIRERVFRQYYKKGTEIESVKWEKIYVKKSQTGLFNTIVLKPNDLNIISYLSVGENSESFETDKPLNKYLKFELIDKALFEKKRPLAVNFLSKNNPGVSKKRGVLSIPTASKVVTFTDNDIDNDGYETFDYTGQINVLKQHLVNGHYWESYDYKMIDKNTGKTTQTFIDYPYISPNKKYIIAAYANPYEQYTDLILYKIDGKEISPIMIAGFKNWMPATEPSDIFWASDGYLYLAVTHSSVFWKEDGSLNDQFQYMRIKIDL